MAAVDNLRRFTAEAFSDLRGIPGNTVPALLRRLERSRHESTKWLVELLQQWKWRADGRIREESVIFSVLLQADVLPLAPHFTTDGTSGAAHGQHDPAWYHLRWFPLRMRCDRDGTCCLMVYIGNGWDVIHADDFKTLWDYSHGLFNGELLADSIATGHAAVGLHRADTRVVQERVSTVDWPAWLGRRRADEAEYLKAVYEDIASWVERAGLPANWGSDATRLVLLPLLAKRFPTEYAFAFLCLYGLWWPLETTLCTGQPASAAAPPAPSAPYPAPITSHTTAPAAPPAPAPETAPAPAPVAASEALEASTKPPAKRQRTSNTAAQLGGAKDRLPPPPGATIIDVEADNDTTGASTYSSSSGTAVASSHADVASQAPANQPAEDGRTDMRSWTTKRCKLWIANAVLPERRQAAMTLVDTLYIGCDQFGTPGAWLAGLLKEDLVKLLRSVDDAAFVYRKIHEAQ